MAAIVLQEMLQISKCQAASSAACVAYFRSYSSASSEVNRTNLSALKRGTGGRSSFNGIVATVFGASGFVGRYVCNRLGKIGTQLIIPYRGDHYDVRPLKLVGDLGQVLFQSFHLRDEESIRKAVKYSNVVINLIGRDWETKNFKFHDVHVEGARRLARIARESGVEKFIHLSALNISEHPKPLLLRNGSQFLASKWHGENAVREEFPEAVIIRPSTIYGQEDRFIRSFRHPYRRTVEKWVSLWRKGELTVKQPVFVSDVAAGIVNAIRDPDANGKIFQAVGPKKYLLSELVDWFHRILRLERLRRLDMRLDPNLISKAVLADWLPGWPVAYVHWEGLEKEAVSDVLTPNMPTLEDLGVNLTAMEDQVMWELRPFRADIGYEEELGEYPDPAPPNVLP